VHLATFVEGMVRGVAFVRPAVLAAIELGVGPAHDFVEATMNVRVHEFVRALRTERPDIGDAEAQTIDRAVHHTTLGAMLDRSVTPSELRNELYLIVEMRTPARSRGDGRQVAASF
jgi:hypothetical protein